MGDVESNPEATEEFLKAPLDKYAEHLASLVSILAKTPRAELGELSFDHDVCAGSDPSRRGTPKIRPDETFLEEWAKRRSMWTRRTGCSYLPTRDCMERARRADGGGVAGSIFDSVRDLAEVPASWKMYFNVNSTNCTPEVLAIDYATWSSNMVMCGLLAEAVMKLMESDPLTKDQGEHLIDMTTLLIHLSNINNRGRFSHMASKVTRCLNNTKETTDHIAYVTRRMTGRTALVIATLRPVQMTSFLDSYRKTSNYWLTHTPPQLTRTARIVLQLFDMEVMTDLVAQHVGFDRPTPVDSSAGRLYETLSKELAVRYVFADMSTARCKVDRVHRDLAILPVMNTRRVDSDFHAKRRLDFLPDLVQNMAIVAQCMDGIRTYQDVAQPVMSLVRLMAVSKTEYLEPHLHRRNVNLSKLEFLNGTKASIRPLLEHHMKGLGKKNGIRVRRQLTPAHLAGARRQEERIEIEEAVFGLIKKQISFTKTTRRSSIVKRATVRVRASVDRFNALLSHLEKKEAQCSKVEYPEPWSNPREWPDEEPEVRYTMDYTPGGVAPTVVLEAPAKIYPEARRSFELLLEYAATGRLEPQTQTMVDALVDFKTE